MKDTEYAYAVARIRSNEASLLSATDIEQLVATQDYNAALRFLAEKGWLDAENQSDTSNAFINQIHKSWQLLNEIAPDITVLEFLITKNDFHNIKATLKAFVTEQLTAAEVKNISIISPSTIDPKLLKHAIFNKKFEELPEFAKEAALKAYDVLIRTADGQLADIMLDAMALNRMLKIAGTTNNQFIIKTAELMCVTANIKIAYRAARTGKDMRFLKTALCDTKTLDKDSLAEAAVKGTEILLRFISGTPYSEASEHLKTSTTSFEKWCDDIIISHIQSAKYISLGVEPLIAFYMAKDTEIKTVRIILSCKYNKLPSDIIRERVRRLYA